MKKFSFNSFIRKQRPKGVFIEAIYGNLGVGISTSASSLAWALQKNCFCLQNFYLNRIFTLVLSYGISTTLLQIIISLRFPIHPLKDVYWCSRKRLFEHSEASVHWCFKKTTAPKASPYFAYFPEKHPGWSSF